MQILAVNALAVNVLQCTFRSFSHFLAVLCISRWISWLSGHSSPLSVLFEVAAVQGLASNALGLAWAVGGGVRLTVWRLDTHAGQEAATAAHWGEVPESARAQ